MSIFQYKNPPSSEELKEKMLAAFEKMGLDTPEKRKRWYKETVKPIIIICHIIEE